MKNRWFLTAVLALVFLAISGNAFSKSRENKATCESWCNANKPRCAFCDSAVFCKGRTYDVIKSFKKGTGNWYACGLSEYGRETRKNKTDCEAWCRNDERCEYCREKVGCGVKHTALKMFGGKGENYYACANREKLSRMRKAECEEYCEGKKDDCYDPCIKCSSKSACGSGIRVQKRFRGKGEHWYACTYIDSREQCEAFCKKSSECKFCSGNPGCGADYTSMKTFRGMRDTFREPMFGFGLTEAAFEYLKKNSYACKKK